MNRQEAGSKVSGRRQRNNGRKSGKIHQTSVINNKVISGQGRDAAVGSESDMDAECFPPDLIIVDDEDAACLTQ